jgi:quercetin dioxygenase-like cupin family protein
VPVIRRAETRRTETPNAVMTTLASPTQGGAGCAVWRVDMRPGQAGPLHAIDTEQIWTVLDGAAVVELDGQRHTVEAGDTVVIAADAPRRVSVHSTAGFAAVVVAAAGMRAYPLDGTTVAPTCAVPDGDKVIPGWVL